ncbi:helix-turn-helix transcriptional regulator, partial [Enterobacter asburiae]|uniref:helix-turn-helix transcriptional regulator n=1 Tax=Enterobacter asburiae TaxID=61645 RepID=UPI002073E7BA
ADRNRSHWSTSKTPSYTKSVSWQHHLRSPLINNMNRKNRLTHSELNILIDCARGLSAYEIASLRHMGYKTVFTHKQNIRLRLSLQKSASWLDLLNRLDQIYSV